MDTRTAEPTTVGEMLREEFLKPLSITQEQLAKAMGVTRTVVSQTVNDQRRITLDEALFLASLFEKWLFSSIFEFGKIFESHHFSNPVVQLC